MSFSHIFHYIRGGFGFRSGGGRENSTTEVEHSTQSMPSNDSQCKIPKDDDLLTVQQAILAKVDQFNRVLQMKIKVVNDLGLIIPKLVEFNKLRCEGVVNKTLESDLKQSLSTFIPEAFDYCTIQVNDTADAFVAIDKLKAGYKELEKGV